MHVRVCVYIYIYTHKCIHTYIQIREWFRNYKSDGKFENGKWVGITEGQNSFGLGEKCMDMAYTKTVSD
jgi:hypothetical protein